MEFADESRLHNGNQAAGLYYPLGEFDAENVGIDRISEDSTRLKQLGYKQELGRGLSFLANFSVTFSILSVMTGITTLYNQGLSFGGPVAMVYGWPIVSLMTMIMGLSMAEICSAYPISAGLYFWSAILCGNGWSPFASWLTGWYVIQLPSVLFVFLFLCFRKIT
ncbi:unnamed protein product [Coffea canephora]|uniref:Amino acid permease/ SLC12A domain-containing protein n=1 Tax=Coffea canephora TaxID=49390 RepID=A0A068TXE8_COFCA|nr:unnamed protein product [Coffea canephora]